MFKFLINLFKKETAIVNATTETNETQKFSEVSFLGEICKIEFVKSVQQLGPWTELCIVVYNKRLKVACGYDDNTKKADLYKSAREVIEQVENSFFPKEFMVEAFQTSGIEGGYLGLHIVYKFINDKFGVATQFINAENIEKILDRKFDLRRWNLEEKWELKTFGDGAFNCWVNFSGAQMMLANKNLSAEIGTKVNVGEEFETRGRKFKFMNGYIIEILNLDYPKNSGDKFTGNSGNVYTVKHFIDAQNKILNTLEGIKDTSSLDKIMVVNENNGISTLKSCVKI